MASKLILDEGKLADAVVEGLRTHAVEIAARRAAQYREAGVKHAPDAAAIEAGLRADAQVLQWNRAALKDASDALEAELGDDAAVFDARDRAAEKVRATLVDFRGLVQANCGAVAVTEVGFSGETPRDPVALEALAMKVLAAVDKKPPKATRRGVRFDAKAVLEGLDTDNGALVAANAAVRREKREEQLARARRNDVWKRFDLELSSATRRLDAALRGVGLAELADRLVPSSAGSAQTMDDSDPAQPPATPAAPR